ncbi:RING finger protein 165 [Galdieria sulphuraria]|nr:RING finger protein 165 [Galdieria sulphuraria]
MCRETSERKFCQSLNVEQADGNAENEKVPNIYYKIQRFLFSGNFSCGLFLPFQFTSFRKERNRGEEPGDNDTTGVNVSSYGEGTVYVTLLPVVQFIRSFSYVPFRFPNPSLTLFSSEREENEDTFRLTANMGEESFDDLLSLQETSTCLSRPADLVLIERCTARRTYQKSANLQPKDTCECSIEKDNCIKTDTMLFRYVHDFCSICLENYSNSDSLRVLPCLHFFHVVCIDKWLMMDKACPLCKWDIDRGLLYSSWEDSWTSEDHPNNYSSAVATSSAIDLIEQEPEIKWGEWFRSLFSLASSV